MNGDDMNDPIEAHARKATDQLLASFDNLDTEAALRAARIGTPTALQPWARSGQTRWIATAAATALIIGGTVALVATRSRTEAPANAPTSVQPTTAPATLPVAPTPPTDTVSPTTSVAPTTSTAPTTTADAAPLSVASVSYLDPPPILPIRPLATISVPMAEDGSFAVAIGEDGIAVGQSTYDEGGATQVDTIGFDGQIRTVPNIDAGTLLAYGPGDVAYLSRPGASIQDFVVVAVPLSGADAGTAVASEPADVNLFVEYPPLSFGHGTDGIIHRRDYLTGTAVAPYVDTEGQPTALDADPPAFTLGTDTVPDGLGGEIISSTGGTWTLEVDAAPDRGDTYVGTSPPAPGENGDGIYVTHIGPNGDPTADFGEPTIWVLATLHPDGTADWWSVPDGWNVVASDIWGTVLARQTGTQLELALTDLDSQDSCPNPPAFEPTTLPDGVSAELLPGDGAQITIGPDGEIEPIEPIDPDVFHYAGQPGTFINIGGGSAPGLSGTDSETIVVLDNPATLTAIEDGYKAEVTHTCGTHTLVASGISRDDFRAFLEGLRPN